MVAVGGTDVGGGVMVAVGGADIGGSVMVVVGCAACPQAATINEKANSSGSTRNLTINRLNIFIITN